MIKVVLLTGPSGAGKTTAQYVFEESGYVVVDNMLPVAINATLEYLQALEEDSKILFIAQPQFVKRILAGLEKRNENIDLKFIVLNCSFKTLLKRFKLSRHVHPSTVLQKMSLTDAINMDRKHIDELRHRCDYYIDTTDMDVLSLRKQLFGVLDDKVGGDETVLSLTIMSYGQKYGNPFDADLILDTRAIPNPYWDEKLRGFSGLDKEVQEYLEKFPIVEETFKKMTDYLDFYLDLVHHDGRGAYTVAVCCSGGRHRSVYFAQRLAKYYEKKYHVFLFHRDIHIEE